MERLRATWLRSLVAALFAVAMLAFGHAHRPLHAAPAFDPAAWTLPDGTAPELCLTKMGPDGDPAGSTHQARCEACLLVHGVAPPPAAAAPIPLRFGDGIAWIAPAAAPHERTVTRSGPARAPPTLLDVIA